MTGKQEKAVLALLTCRTLADAAAVAGVNEKTIRRWLKQPKFKAALAEARAQVFQAVAGRLTRYAVAACDKLHYLVQKKGVSDAVKVRAAAVILRTAVGIRLGELSDQIGEVEQQYREMQAEQRGRL